MVVPPLGQKIFFFGDGLPNILRRLLCRSKWREPGVAAGDKLAATGNGWCR
jgi:hypothetical protein